MRNGKRRVMLFEATRSIIDKRSEAIQSHARFTWSRGPLRAPDGALCAFAQGSRALDGVESGA